MNLLERILNKIYFIIYKVDRSIAVTDLKEIKNSTIRGKGIINSGVVISKSTISGNINIKENCSIKNSKVSGNLSMGRNSILNYCSLWGNITIGNNTTLAGWGLNLTVFTGKQSLAIGNFCSIARNTTFQLYNHNHKKITSYFIGNNLFNEKWENEKTSKGNTIIGNDVWIGTHCVILGGLKIGDGALIAANSVINKDIPPFAIVAGSPAKIIGYRFSQDIIDKLFEIKWWDWDLNKIKKNKALFENELSLNAINEIKNS